jgi:hypothetical protein
MKILLIASMPHEPFNTAVRDGTAGKKMGAILAALKPEATYFAELNGKRTAILAVDLKDASQIPALAEPWFLTFQADVQLRPFMTSEDLQRGGLDQLGKKWA